MAVLLLGLPSAPSASRFALASGRVSKEFQGVGSSASLAMFQDSSPQAGCLLGHEARCCVPAPSSGRVLKLVVWSTAGYILYRFLNCSAHSLPFAGHCARSKLPNVCTFHNPSCHSRMVNSREPPVSGRSPLKLASTRTGRQKRPYC